jgi:hypothetical protein
VHYSPPMKDAEERRLEALAQLIALILSRPGMMETIQKEGQEMKIYSGTKATMDLEGNPTVLVETNGKTAPLSHVVTHSPTGMNWGYGGSGPADLALSILTDAVGGRLARQYYQDFKRDFVATWGSSWRITSQEIKKWLEEKRPTM